MPHAELGGLAVVSGQSSYGSPAVSASTTYQSRVLHHIVGIRCILLIILWVYINLHGLHRTLQQQHMCEIEARPKAPSQPSGKERLTHQQIKTLLEIKALFFHICY